MLTITPKQLDAEHRSFYAEDDGKIHAEEPSRCLGSTVYLTAGKISQRADVISEGNFASSNDPRVHFGLGDTATVDDVEIRWPSETVEKIRTPAVDQSSVVHEGLGITEGFAPGSLRKPVRYARLEAG